MVETQKKTAKPSWLIYLLLANGITWLCWIPGLIIGGQQGYLMPNFDTYAILFREGFVNTQHMLLAIAFQLGVYGPLIAGLVAIWMDSGREGLHDLWTQIRNWKIAGRWYLTVLLIVIFLAGLPVLVFGLVRGFNAGIYPFTYILFVFIAQLFTSGLGEETGWRGYLLPRLRTRYKDDRYVWTLGLIWAAWHYPLMIIQNLNAMTDVPLFQAVAMVLLSLAGFTISIMGITFIYVWLYNQTGSLFLMIVFHALSNTFNAWFSTLLVAPQAATFFIALMPWVVVTLLQWRFGKNFMLRGPAGKPADM